MKKFFAVLMALVLMLSATSAFAELSQYMMVGIQDEEGNVVTAEDLPVLVFVIDNETDACAFGTEENLIEGVWECVEETDEYLLLSAVLDDGTELEIVYLIAEDAFAFTDPESGITFVLANLDTLTEEAA